MVNSILQVENLVKRYGDVEAVRGVSFAVEEGEVFGLLGPNGAGKTSTVEILEGLRTLDSGRVSVCGLDPQRNAHELKHESGGATLRSCSSASVWKKSAIPFTASSLADKSNAWHSPWLSSTIPRSCFSTSRPPGSIRRCGEKYTTSSRN